MKIHKWRKKKMLMVILMIMGFVAAGVGGYIIYGSYKINELSKMTFEEMLDFTVKNNKDAVITVGIIQNGKTTYKVYGENGMELPQEEHIYEIGSVTKTFTTALLFKSISEGKVSLDDSIDEYLDLPEKSYYPTIKRLVTHTSGYKGSYFEMPMVANFLQGKNDFNGISGTMLINRLSKINLNDSDYSYRYSNFGMATLGAVLEQIHEEDYTALMNAFVREDLGLSNTKVSESSGDLDNYWEWSESDAYIPAGGILSTITDMLAYVQTQLSNRLTYLSLAHEPLTDINASSEMYQKMGIHMDAIGAGWMIDNGNNIIWHNGGTGNYNSYVGFDKDNQIGVVILSNLPPKYRIPTTVMGIELLTSLQN
ncbi:serine hydrolase domain-containing protein [Jeotgalibaca sp. A122]|uniref:serine hydrolase domain-containing protein n=1 Tax=Jeotgalibaca sp. A122 TaxID=3457322 RepID=UPI003FD0680D